MGFDDLTPVAVVLEKTDKTVTYERYIDHGRLKFDKRVTISVEDFEYYYHPVNNIEYNVLKCLGYMNICGDYDYDSDDDSEGGLIADD